MNAKDISLLAIIISASSFLYNLYVSFPRMRISANVETLQEIIIDNGIPYPSQGDTILWITISNNSPRRILITNVTARWTWNLLFPFQWKYLELNGLVRTDQGKHEPVTDFWVEPWSRVVLGKNIDDEEDIEYELGKRFSEHWDGLFHFALNYRITLFDAQQKKYHSNKIKIINPSIRHKKIGEILKIIFSKKK